MRRLHYFSGFVITLFVGVHMINHALSLWGVDVHIAFMDMARLVYRNPVSEMLLLTAVGIQIGTGLRLFAHKRNAVHGIFEKMHLWTGLYLAMFFLIHVGAVLTGRYMLNLDTNFYFGAAGLNLFPLNVFFIPYYGLAIVSFFGHISAIHSLKMKHQLFGLSVQQQSQLIVATGIVVNLVVLYGLTNGFTGIEIPKEYNFMGEH
ncbi:MAG: hypothetical protein AAGI38_18725 [Bacteroidota bacterium]